MLIVQLGHRSSNRLPRSNLIRRNNPLKMRAVGQTVNIQTLIRTHNPNQFGILVGSKSKRLAFARNNSLTIGRRKTDLAIECQFAFAEQRNHICQQYQYHQQDHNDRSDTTDGDDRFGDAIRPIDSRTRRSIATMHTSTQFHLLAIGWSADDVRQTIAKEEILRVDAQQLQSLGCRRRIDWKRAFLDHQLLTFLAEYEPQKFPSYRIELAARLVIDRQVQIPC